MTFINPVVEGDVTSICNNLSSELKNLSGSQVLITGGGGFLGYYFVHTLLYWNRTHTQSKKIGITVLDNFKIRKPPWISGFENHEVTLLEADITKGFSPPMPVNYIFHCASIASPISYRKFPIETIDTNVSGLRVLLDHAVRHRDDVLGLLYFSSSEIYGDPPPEAIPTPETFLGFVSCTGPRACYDESKRLGETLCFSFFAQHQIPAKIVRPFNNFGPGLSLTDGRIMADLAKSVIQDESIILYSDGSPKRTYCYVSDAITGFFQVLMAGKNAEPYNIGSPGPEISVLDAAKKVKAIAKMKFGYDKPIIQKSSNDPHYLRHNPQRRCPDLKKISSELGYLARVSLDEGIVRYLDWAKKL